MSTQQNNLQPNIVIICSDQHRASSMACYGNSICHTPNLDKLAEQGVLFEKCFTQNPVCSPARASLLTGCLSRKTDVVRNGIPLKNEIPTVADILQDKAYQTTAIG
jgi:arylsulfatase A-like enzyme